LSIQIIGRGTIFNLQILFQDLSSVIGFLVILVLVMA